MTKSPVGRTPSEDAEVSWHALGVPAALEALGTDPLRGLSTTEAAQRLTANGANALTRQRRRSRWAIAGAQFRQPLVLILIGAGAVTTFVGEYVDAVVIMAVVIVNAIIGFVQESKALQAIEALAKSMGGDATVIRDGERHVITVEAVVDGDVVVLQAGDRVPADLRLLHTEQFHVNEAALTGESVPVGKSPDVLAADVLMADRRNLAFSSALVTAGTATGVVVATGDATQIGRVNELIASAEVLATPLTRRIDQFSRILLWVILTLAALTVALGVLRGESWLEVFLAAVALAVAAIPEGLPAAMTITLAIGVHRMARRNAIIRRLPAVETLGSTTVICSDKTGTLTQNAMTVRLIEAGGRTYSISGVGYAPLGTITPSGSATPAHDTASALPPAVAETLRAGALCNDAHVLEEDGQWHVAGDPTEGALIVAAAKAGLEADALADAAPRIHVLPFQSQYQLMATLHETTVGHIVYLKGSVERILACCQDSWTDTGATSPLNHDAVHAAAESMAGHGLRVLAFATAQVPADTTELTHADISAGLSFLGLQAMMDPPREQTSSSIAACHTAGIHVKMVTGDHRVTAAAIAADIGLVGDADAHPIGGTDLAAASDSYMSELVERHAVFARVAPEQKLRLVESLQADGHVVAMTGDGVNDAPALKRADIGVAMGRSGTEVAKESADMILTDDDFSTITAAVEEGRGVYDNLIKFITWTLPTNVGEGLVIFTAILAGVTLPVTPAQILWINMTTAVLLGLTLAFERKEPNIMTRPPRDPAAAILSPELIVRILIVGLLLLATAYGLFQVQLAAGASLAQAQTVAANMFVFGELFYLFNCRSLHLSMWRIGLFSNRLLLAGVGMMVLFQLAFTYLPVMQVFFATAPLSLTQWGQILASALLIYAAVGVHKWWQQRSRHHGAR